MFYLKFQNIYSISIQNFYLKFQNIGKKTKPFIWFVIFIIFSRYQEDDGTPSIKFIEQVVVLMYLCT